jgi:multidrug transporter EmrE-like cation transporter
MSDFLGGIISILIGTAINNFGIVFQKRQVNLHSLNSNNNNVKEIKPSFSRDPLWILGILMQTLISLPFFFYGLNELGITLTQPLSNAGVIFLVLGLIWLLKEKFQPIERWGVVLLVVGMISIGIGNVVGDITLDSFFQPEAVENFWIFFLIIIGCFLLCLVDIEYLQNRYVVVEESGNGVYWRIGTNETTFPQSNQLLFAKMGSGFDTYGDVTPFILAINGTWIATYTGAATVSGWNQNRIAAWYPYYNFTLCIGKQIIRPWAVARDQLVWNLNNTQIGESLTLQYSVGSNIICTKLATIQSGSNNFFFDAEKSQIFSA